MNLFKFLKHIEYFLNNKNELKCKFFCRKYVVTLADLHSQSLRNREYALRSTLYDSKRELFPLIY